MESIAKVILVASCLAVSFGPSWAQARAVIFTFTDVIEKAGTPGIEVGDVFTLQLYANNGVNSLVSQTWEIKDLRHFTISAGTYFGTYSRVWQVTPTEYVQTDHLGNVAAVQFSGTADDSKNVDNFGSWTGNGLDGDGQFCDIGGNPCNRIQVRSFSDASKWTVALAPNIPEPSSWALVIMGFGAAGATLRRRRSLA